MPLRPSARHGFRSPSRRLRLERLEDRWLPSTLTYTAPSGNGFDDLLLRRNGNQIELYNHGTLVRSQNLNGLTAIRITGANGEDDRLTVDFNVGGMFSVRDGITFSNAAGASGTDTLVINATNSADAITITTGQVTVNGSNIFFTGAEALRVNALGGPDTVVMTGTNPDTATTVDAGDDGEPDTVLDTFRLDLRRGSGPHITYGDFAGTLYILHFDETRLFVGNFSGHVTITGSGTLDEGVIQGDIEAGSELMAEDIIDIKVTGTVRGTIHVEGSGTIENAEIGEVGETGTISGEDIIDIAIQGNMAGTLTTMEPHDPDSTGGVGNLSIGGDFTGTVDVYGSLESMTVDGRTTGDISAGDIGVITVEAAEASSPVLSITEGGVLRQLIATLAGTDIPTPPGVKFAYVYDSTGPGDPQLIVRVTNSDGVRFDLSLTTSTSGKFHLSRLFAAGPAGLNALAVEGDVLTTVPPSALAFFGLPAGTPGGVFLPEDALVGVAAQGNVPAGSIRAASVQAVAFGSTTRNGATTLAEAATRVNAASLLAPGTATVRADGTARVPFAEGRPVALFLNTGTSTFDGKNVLFTDLLADDQSVSAVVTMAAGGITSIEFQGDGGSVQTSQSVSGPITSTGPLGDLTLSSSAGVGDVTAPSIFGTITTSGPIWGTIQTTAGDLGTVITNATGAIVGVTTISTTQGIPGRIVSRGHLISQVNSQKAFSGVLAAEGDIGVASVNAAGQLVRYGGFLSNGQFTGRIVALGSIRGDIIAKNGLAGRIAAGGSILGNVLVSGSIDAGGAIVSAGVIGDAAAGTVLSTGAIKGIVAAKGAINFGGTGNTTAATIIANASGANAAAIDAIFTYNNGQALTFDLPGEPPLTGLQLILDDLAVLSASGGTLFGPTP